MEHELKCWPEYFEPLATGVKPFEVRRADRAFAVGDTLRLREFIPSRNGFTWSPGHEPSRYTGRVVTRAITYRLDGGVFGVDPGYCVLGLSGAAPAIKDGGGPDDTREGEETMSKASEWAFQAAELIGREAILKDRWGARPKFVLEGGTVAGEVTATGRLCIQHPVVLTPRESAAFARWILDTFVDEDNP